METKSQTLPDSFLCADCQQTKPVQHDGGTGYATRPRADGGEDRICYDCCAVVDRAHMLEHGSIVLYLTRKKGTERETLVPSGAGYRLRQGTLDAWEWEITNWPGTLRFDVLRVKRSTGYGFGVSYERIDAWFIGPGPSGPMVWHAVNAGNMQIARCKRTKRAARVQPAPTLPPNTTAGVLP